MKELSYGDVREDGFIFRGYNTIKGVRYEMWGSPEAVARNLIKQNEASRERNAKKDPAKKAEDNRRWKQAAKEKRDLKAKTDPAYREILRQRREKKSARQRERRAALTPEEKAENRCRYNDLARKNRASCPVLRLRQNTRVRIYEALQAALLDKTMPSCEMVGCSWEHYKTHLEMMLHDGMTWDNYGEWHVDHIIPLASAKTNERLKELFHYSNTQPLWAMDNWRKSAKMPTQHQSL